jgi:ligand-binding sensor domain-containing protein
MKVDGELYAGTFVGGLARFDGAKWHVFPELRGQNVTALEVNERGALYIATRYGLWRRRGDGTLARLPHDVADSEVQALCAVHGGMWIGTRTGLYFLKT